jgi:hypothetical protein
MENNNDLHIVKYELYDPDVMEQLLRDVDNFSKQDLKRLKLYKKNRLHGNSVEVVYHYGKGCEENQLGRLYVKNNIGLQSFPFDIRNPLLEKNYWDIDGENMHYVLMSKLGESWGINVDYIKYYCNNRDQCLQQLSSNRKIAKTAFLKVAYGGNVKLYNDFYNDDNLDPEGDITLLKNIETETKNLMEMCYIKYTQFHNIVKKKNNPKASLFALILQTEERKCILTLDNYFKSIGRSVDILIHDGLEIRKLPNETQFPNELLINGENAIFQNTGYKIKLICKPLKHNFKINKQPKIIIDDIYAAKKFIELMGENIVRNNNDIYYFNVNNGMWEKDDYSYRIWINKLRENLIFRDNENNKDINYAGNEKNVTNMKKWFLPLLENNEFINNNADSSIGKLLFNDGYYDFTTDTFTNQFNRNIVFFKKINRNYPTERNEKLIKFVNETLFIKPFTENDKHDTGIYLKKILCMGLFGDYLRKNFTMAIGEPNSSKGVIVNAFRLAFEGYIDEFDANNLLYNQYNTSDQAVKLKWLDDFIGTRINFSNEAKMNELGLCGNLIKSLVSGSDIMKIRKNYESQFKFINKSALIFLANDIPKITPNDQAIFDRISVATFTKKFVNNPTESNEELADPSIKIKFSENEYKNSLFFLMIDTYNQMNENEKKIGGFIEKPETVIINTKKWIKDEKTDIFDKLNEKYDITNNDNDKTPMSEIIEYLTVKCNVNMSATKIGIIINKIITLENKDKIINKKKYKLGIKIRHYENQYTFDDC